MSGHVLHLRFGLNEPEWHLTCEHEHGEFPMGDEAGNWVSDDCWVTDWWDNLAVEDVLWRNWTTNQLTFPMPVRAEFDDGLVLSPETP